ncbi:MAG: hypothetical protein AAFU64_08055 [Bacteroidota bacterium]
MGQEDRIKKIINSLEGIQKAKPRSELMPQTWEKIQSASPPEEVKIIPLRTLRWAAASVLLLVGINAYAFVSYLNNNRLSEQETNTSYQEVWLNYNLYEE